MTDKTASLGQKTFETNRLVVRGCGVADAPALTRLMTAEVSKWLAVWPFPLSDAKATQIIEEARAGPCFAAVITLKETGEIIGWIKIDVDGERAELGYWIGARFQRLGYGVEVTRAAISFAFDRLGVRTVEAGAQIENAASTALFEKLGMVYAGEQTVWAPARQRSEACVFWRITAP